MGREISIFSDYHQKENSLSNYCGLLLKILYQESPRRFQELLSTMIKAKGDIIIGPSFSQQTKQIKSIPDLIIVQKSFVVYFETKRSNWFYNDQIFRHVEGFKSSDLKILFLLSNFEEDELENLFRDQIEKAEADGVILQPISFEDFIGSLEQVCQGEYLSNLLEEFKIYLDRNSYLPKWKYLLDVVNCKGTLNEIDSGVYMCPDTGSNYSHRRAKFFGAYANKGVREIFEIKAVVAIARGMKSAKIKWKNVSDDDKSLIDEAVTKLQKWDWRIKENISVPIQAFLLTNREPTNFVKSTSGGMLQSKKYFWDIALNCKTSKELALALNGKFWT